MTTGFTYFLIFVLLVGLGYGVYHFVGKESETNQTATHIDLGTKGIAISDVIKGEGKEVKRGDVLTLHYVGKLTNGVQFDSSYDRGAPFSFTLGSGEVIEGWDQGLEGAQVGTTRRLVIAPERAYGSAQVGIIPPDSTLIFEITLLSIH